jgi:hypothetical protein
MGAGEERHTMASSICIVSSMTALARAALWYARRGWRVFPCVAGKKLPAIKGWPKLATADLRQVETWWRIRPDSNIGIACGPEAGLYVLDVDQHGTDGEEALAALVEKLGPLPETMEQRTGSGGRQLLFGYPHGRDLRNKAGSDHQSKYARSAFRLPPGIDSRGEGGFVVVPPSLHPCGENYRWIRGPHEIERALLPEPWVAALERKRPVTITVPVRPLRNVDGDVQDVSGLIRFVQEAGEGNRNAALYWTARKLVELHRLGLIRDLRRAEVREAAVAAGLARHEVERTIASALQAEGVA